MTHGCRERTSSDGAGVPRPGRRPAGGSVYSRGWMAGIRSPMLVQVPPAWPGLAEEVRSDRFRGRSGR
ncbi:hypothetical protein ACFPM0_24100 [Pseudonocardia sulfidoxydans]|uniref:hypothetical protein n=1 Tax=Pseudonocardia sulfidoxydans TaxID=54011 RepID=UPI00361D772F